MSKRIARASRKAPPTPIVTEVDEVNIPASPTFDEPTSIVEPDSDVDVGAAADGLQSQMDAMLDDSESEEIDESQCIRPDPDGFRTPSKSASKSPPTIKRSRATPPPPPSPSGDDDDDDDDGECESSGGESLATPQLPPQKRRRNDGGGDTRQVLDVIMKQMASFQQQLIDMKSTPAPVVVVASASPAPPRAAVVSPAAVTYAFASPVAEVEAGFFTAVSRNAAESLYKKSLLESIQEVRAATGIELKNAIDTGMSAAVIAGYHEELRVKIEAIDAKSSDPIAIEAYYFEMNRWRHPDETMRLYCERENNHLWWEDQQTHKWKFTVKKAAQGDKVYTSVRCPDPPQRFMGLNMSSTTFIMPLCQLQYARLYPHGNKDVTTYRPDAPYKVKFEANCTELGFSSVFESRHSNLDGGGNRSNINRFFDSWAGKGDKHQWMANVMYETDAFATRVKTQMKQSLNSAQRDNGAFMRELFCGTHVKPAVIMRQDARSIKVGHDLTRGLYKGERTGGAVREPYVAHTQYLHDLYYHPDAITPDPKKPPPMGPDGKPRTHHDPRVLNDIPLLRARTYAELLTLKQRQPDVKHDPFVLVAQADRYLMDTDLVFPVVELDMFHSNATGDKAGASGFCVKAFIWVGQSYSLNESIQSLPKSADRSEFFVMAQQYTRRGVPVGPYRPRDMEVPSMPGVDHMLGDRSKLAQSDAAEHAANVEYAEAFSAASSK